MWKKILIISVIILLIAGGIYYYYSTTTATAARAAFASIETAPLQKGTIASTVSATGKVRSKQTATLVWSTSGTVETVAAKEGDTVKSGQELAKIKLTTLPQGIITAQADLVNAQTALTNLDSTATTSKVKALSDIATYEGQLRDARYQLDNFTVPTGQANLSIIDALEQTRKKLAVAQKAFDPYKFAPESDLTRKDLLTALSAAQADYNTAVKRLAYEYQVEVAQTNLNQAWANFEKYKNGPDPADVQAAQAKIAAAQAALAQSSIAAPFDGAITNVNVRPGDQVASGRTAFRIDDLSTLYVDLSVSEIDISQIKPGQPVTVTFDALPNKSYKGVVDQVALISADTATTVNFTVTVKVTNPDKDVRPGMTSEVKIIVSQKEGALLLPLQAIQTINGKQTVYAQKAGQGYQQIEVSIGISSDLYGELVKGDLTAGEKIVLNPVKFIQQRQQANSNNRFPFMGGPGGPPGGGARNSNDRQNNAGGSSSGSNRQNNSGGGGGGQP